ncbi:MAG: RNA methyltransferase [Candidatus Niyogibacteria bacterium]|nr:MAG: RNA methyltransferase [Candidatus Niyogibacteria bacterium]
MKILKVRNKNAMMELLRSGANFDKISIVNDLEQDNLTKEIITLAKSRGIRIVTAPIGKMAKRRSGQTREVLVGFLVPENIRTLGDLLDEIYKKNQDPFFLLVNRVDFESNIGVIARTAFASGVNGLIFQGDEDRFFNEETTHFSMGAIARIPLIKMNIFEALKELRKNGIKTFCVQTGGGAYYGENFLGPVAFVLGAEGEGLSEGVSSRCDKKISIPMRKGIDSLNVGVSAGIVLYEKVRQNGGAISNF